MITVNYDLLPTEVATFRDYLTLAVKYPQRGFLIEHLQEEIKKLEDFTLVYPTKVSNSTIDYLYRTKNVYDFVLAYTTEDGKFDG
jgi:hypothetical protein